MVEQKITVAVIGSGAWGSAFGQAIAAPGCAVIFWDRSSNRAAAAAAAAHCRAAENLTEAAAEADMIIIAVSSGGFADVLRQLAPVTVPLLWLTKGFEPASGEPLYQIVAGQLAAGAGAGYGAISGPSFAAEVERGLPTALSLAFVSAEAEAAAVVQRQLHRPKLRLYRHDDIIGVSVGGAVKNVIAIAAGISDGLALGENARAALIARGLNEMSLLNRALGGCAETLLGLSGVGDLTLTCCSGLSRNRQLGIRIAAEGIERALTAVTCEGVNAAACAVAVAERFQLDVPIIRAVQTVLTGAVTADEAARQLLARAPA